MSITVQPVNMTDKSASKKPRGTEKETTVIKDGKFANALRDLAVARSFKDESEKKDKEARLVILGHGVDRFLKNKSGGSFVLSDGKGASVLVTPMDKCTAVNDDVRMRHINDTYGKGTVKKEVSYAFDNGTLSKLSKKEQKVVFDAVKKALSQLDIHQDAKDNMLKSESEYTFAEDMPSRIRDMKHEDAKKAIADLGMQLQVKNPSVEGLEIPSVFDLFNKFVNKARNLVGAVTR